MRSSKAQPAPPPPPPTPEAPPARSDPIVVQNEAREAVRRKRGRAATVLTGNSGDTSRPVTGTVALLGGSGG